MIEFTKKWGNVYAPPGVDESEEYRKENNIYTGATKKSEKSNGIYKGIAEKYNCYFLSNQGLETGIDGVHLTKESHKKLAEKLKEEISHIYIIKIFSQIGSGQ